MVKVMNESTRLLYGTGDVQTNAANANANATRPKTRAWYGVAAALLCTGALVSKQWHAPSSSANANTNALRVTANSAVAPVNNNDAVNAAAANLAVELANVELGANGEFKAFYDSLNAFANASADPCTDFYEYACGNWLATHDIPSDGASIDASFYAVSQDNKKIIQAIIDAKPPVIGEFYESCVTKTEDVDAGTVAYVSDIIRRIHLQNSTFELLSFAGELDQGLGISSFFDVGVQADPSNPDMNVLTLSQGGLTLPSREYYLEKAKLDKYSALYLQYVKDLFSKGDLDKHNASKYAANILETEVALAKISLPNAELRDPWSTNTPFTLQQVRREFPYLAAYLDGIDKQEKVVLDVPVIVTTPKFFEKQNAVLSSLKLEHLKNYVSFHVIDSFGDVLGEFFRRVSHDFHGTVRGAGSLAPRAQFCVDTTTTYLGTQIGEYYMLKVFGTEAKASAQSLVDQIEDSMNRLLSTEDWLDEATVAAAREKLQHVRNYIGGPDQVSALPFKIESDKFFDNVLSLKQLAANSKVRGIGKPVDRQSWDMFASTVNAYYDPSANKMVFPAAILQPPFYSAKAYPAAANYARIGMVMGHELSHGFDDQGRNYDAKGTLRKWWTPGVSKEFEARAQCLSSQYSSFPVVAEGQLLGNLNGNLTLGENIADNGGIHLSYQAYQIHKNATGVTAGKTTQEDDRVFFLSFAQQWCEKRSAGYSEVLRQTDPHSPGRWRVNGPAINFAKFAETFQCPVGSAMNPEKRCVIW